MIHFESHFLKPNKELRLLHALDAIAGNPRISQHQLAREVGISSAMANAYVRDLEAGGWIQRQGRSNRSMRYLLTEDGAQHKRELLLSSSIEIMQLYGLVRREFERRLQEIVDQGVMRLALFGASDTGEVALAAAHKTRVQVVGAVDNDPARQGARFGELTIEHPDRLGEWELDGVLVTSFAHGKAIHEQLRPVEARGIKVFRI